MTEVLATKPRYVRFAKAPGNPDVKVDRQGGKFGAGILRGVSVITKGEALGHGVWIDDVFLDQVDEAINSLKSGAKSRFTHPQLSGDGLGKLTSRVFDSERRGDQVFADQHFLMSAHRAPDGDLAGYLMDLAEEDPEGYGLSIVFGFDYGEMDRFRAEHTDADGYFHSPDADNVHNFPHARLDELRAVDAVDEPAANPSGLWHREQTIADEATKVAEFALGLSDIRPEVASLGLDADRVRGFVSRFLSSHDLEIRQMSDQAEAQAPPKEAPAAEQPTNNPPAPETVVETPTETTPATTENATPAEQNGRGGDRSEWRRFREAFGDQAGEYYDADLTFEEAMGKHVAWQSKRIGELEQKLSAGTSEGETAPVNFQPSDKQKRAGLAGKLRIRD